MQIAWSRLSKLSSPIWINFATFQSYFYLVSTKIFICEITIVNLHSGQYDHYLQISTGPLCLKVIDSKAAPCPQLRIKSSSSWNAERWSKPFSQNTQVQQPLDQNVNLTLLDRWMMALLLFYICFFLNSSNHSQTITSLDTFVICRSTMSPTIFGPALTSFGSENRNVVKFVSNWSTKEQLVLQWHVHR